MKCSNCGFEQDVGKFCSKCGGEILPQSQDGSTKEYVAASEASSNNEPAASSHVNHQTSTSQAPVTPANSGTNTTNDSLERVKETSRAYGGFFMNYVKHPSQVFTKKSSELTNGLISIGIMVVITLLTFNILIKNQLGGFSGYGPSFMSIFFNGLFGMAIVLGIVITLLFLINKLFGTDSTYKDVVSIFGAHMTPVIVVSALAFLLAIFKSNTFAAFLLFLVLMLIVSIVPLYLISSLLTRRPKGIDPLYGYLLYILAFIITFMIVMSIMIDSALGDMIEIIDGLVYYM